MLAGGARNTRSMRSMNMSSLLALSKCFKCLLLISINSVQASCKSCTHFDTIALHNHHFFVPVVSYQIDLLLMPSSTLPSADRIFPQPLSCSNGSSTRGNVAFSSLRSISMLFHSCLLFVFAHFAFWVPNSKSRLVMS